MTSDCMMGFRWLESGSEFNFNRLCMVLMGVARHHNYLQLNGVKLNTIQFFSITGKTELVMKNRRIKALKPVLHLVFIKITIAFSVYKQILVFVLYENLNVYSGECVCVCFLSKMPGMRASTDLIVPFTSVCLQKSAGE